MAHLSKLALSDARQKAVETGEGSTIERIHDVDPFDRLARRHKLVDEVVAHVAFDVALVDDGRVDTTEPLDPESLRARGEAEGKEHTHRPTCPRLPSLRMWRSSPGQDMSDPQTSKGDPGRVVSNRWRRTLATALPVISRAPMVASSRRLKMLQRRRQDMGRGSERVNRRHSLGRACADLERRRERVENRKGGFSLMKQLA